jgi:hypothetical protein
LHVFLTYNKTQSTFLSAIIIKTRSSNNLTDAPANFPKRAPKSSAPTLACLTAVTGAQSSSSISFACSCLSVKTQTVSVTSSSTLQIRSTSYLPATETTATTIVLEVVTVLPSTTVQTIFPVETDYGFCFGLTIVDAPGDPSLIGDVLELSPESPNGLYNLVPFPNTLVPTANGNFILPQLAFWLQMGLIILVASRRRGGCICSLLCYYCSRAKIWFGTFSLQY